MPGSACCSARDDASMTESPIAVMSVPGTSSAACPAVLALAFPPLAVLVLLPVTALAGVAIADAAARARPSASALAPCETCHCRPLGPADGLITEQPAAQATTIAPRMRPRVAMYALDMISLPESRHRPGSRAAHRSFPGRPAGKRRSRARAGIPPGQCGPER